LGAAFVESAFSCEAAGEIGCFHLEAPWPGKTLIEREIVQ
jgi:hypothetical protein